MLYRYGYLPCRGGLAGGRGGSNVGGEGVVKCRGRGGGQM